MNHKEQLLAWIVDSSKPNTSATNPHGYVMLEAGHEHTATELHNEELIQALVTNRQPDGSFPVRPTDMGVKWASAAGQPQTTQAAPQQTPSVKIEQGVPIPDKKAFGRESGPSGNDKVTLYGFANMPINGSFFIPQDNKVDKDGVIVPIHRGFSSTVSQANAKLHPMAFVIREWVQPDGTKGARVWRTEDMQGPRPTRTKKAKDTPSQPAFQQQPANFPGGFAAPGNPGFGAPGGFAPQPFAAPAEPQAQQGQWDAAPSFGALPPFGG